MSQTSGNRAPQDPWNSTLSAQVGASIRRARTDQGISVTALSRKLAAFGYKLGRGPLGMLERGERTATLADILAIGAVLGVPPTVLVFDPDALDLVEALPGRSMPGYQALAWCSGAAALPGDGLSDSEWLAQEGERVSAIGKAAKEPLSPLDQLSALVMLQELLKRAAAARAEAQLKGEVWRSVRDKAPRPKGTPNTIPGGSPDPELAKQEADRASKELGWYQTEVAQSAGWLRQAGVTIPPRIMDLCREFAQFPSDEPKQADHNG